MATNNYLKDKSIIFNGEEYIVDEPLGTGEYYWRIRNINYDTTEDISVELIKSKIKTYEEDLFKLKNKGIKAIYNDNGFIEIFINGQSKKIIGGENLSEISDLLKLISNSFDINLIEENS